MITPDAATPSTEYVIYHSQGKCLIIGACGSLEGFLDRANRPADISLHVLVTDPASRHLHRLCEANGYPLFQGRVRELQGHLGRFRVQWQAEGTGTAEPQTESFDLVVDLSQPPLIGAEVVPFGYFVPGEKQSSVLDELGQWIGEFEKPRYFSYQADLCAHGGPHRQGCRACIEVCPAQAIVSVAEKRIEVDPYLCQGCGDCTTVCPSGALSYRALERKTLLETLIRQLSGAPGAGIVFHRETETVPARFGSDGWIRQPVPTVAACGPEVWLALLAAGARQICLQRQGLLPGSQENLERQMAWVNALLVGLGYGRHRIVWLEEPPEYLDPPPPGPGQPAVLADKRNMLELALHRLIQQAAQLPEWVPLPQGAPIGTVEVDGERCTLCLACVAGCPSQALQAGDDDLQLRLVEQNCLQCGWCADVCPENAIRLVPRLLTDNQRRRQPRLLHQEVVFNCLDCGKAFANRKIIEAVLNKITGHPMFADARQRRRLLLCEECRVRDLMRDHER